MVTVGRLERHLPTAPNVDGRCVSFLPQQQFWRSIPQRDDFVGVRAAGKDILEL